VGHDIGHVPLGHPGEKFLGEAMGRGEFCHEIMGPIVAQKVERSGKGLNLTIETLEGMMGHSGTHARSAMSAEGWVVRFTDKIAYIFHDYNDLQRMGFPVETELVALMDQFGKTQRERTTTAIAALVIESAECNKVSFSQSKWVHSFNRIRGLMYTIYPRITEQDPRSVADPVLSFLASLKIGDPFLLYALMTDKEVLELSATKMRNITHFHKTAVSELMPHLGKLGTIDLCAPCLDW
jgi:dGTP triphosphohydrolase